MHIIEKGYAYDEPSSIFFYIVTYRIETNSEYKERIEELQRIDEKKSEREKQREKEKKTREYNQYLILKEKYE